MEFVKTPGPFGNSYIQKKTQYLCPFHLFVQEHETRAERKKIVEAYADHFKSGFNNITPSNLPHNEMSNNFQRTHASRCPTHPMMTTTVTDKCMRHHVRDNAFDAIGSSPTRLDSAQVGEYYATLCRGILARVRHMISTPSRFIKN